MRLREKGLLLTVLIAVIVAAMYLIFFLDRETVRWLTREDNVVESVGALLFLLASIGFGVAYLRPSRVRRAWSDSTGAARRSVFHLLLCLLFLLAFLEEISWGQRILKVETPDAIREVNRQGEINLHNLRWFHGHDESGNRKPFLELLINGDRMFSMFWFGYCVAVPLVARFSRRMSGLFVRIRLPVVPMAYVFLFLFNYLLARAVIAGNPAYRHNIVEVKETAFSFLFMCIAVGQIYPPWKRTCGETGGGGVRLPKEHSSATRIE